jgi:hypothetical protein
MTSGGNHGMGLLSAGHLTSDKASRDRTIERKLSKGVPRRKPTAPSDFGSTAQQ